MHDTRQVCSLLNKQNKVIFACFFPLVNRDSYEAIHTLDLSSVESEVRGYDVIGVDEGQFVCFHS